MASNLRNLICLLLLLAIGSLAGGVTLAAEPVATPVAQDSGITLTTHAAFGGIYRAGSWLPVVIDLANSGFDRTVEVRVGARNGAQYAAEVELPNNGRKSITIYTYLAGSVRRLTVRVYANGAELLSQNVAVQPAAARAHLVGLWVGSGAALQLPNRLPDNSPLATVALAAADLPGNALGLSSFETIVLDDAPTIDLAEPQRAALREWVFRGGQLFVSGGDGAARSLAGLSSELQIVRINGVDPVAAATFLGDSAVGAADIPLAAYDLVAAPDDRLPYTLPVAGLPDDLDLPPVVEQSVGRGVITFFVAPLGHPAVAGWSELPAFWESMLHTSNVLPTGFAPDNVSYDAFIEGNVASALTNLPALNFPPLLTLGLLILAYILVIGPGLYLLLRRLDRQILGWVLVPMVTLIFAGLAYGIGYAQRGGDVVFNQITLVEALDGAAGNSRVRSFVGVFSPARQGYTLVATDLIGGDPLLRPISVQGPWDTAGGGAGGIYLQDAGSGQARDFEVAQWSMRALASDTIGSYTGLDAVVTIDGDKLRGEVVNRSQEIYQDVSLVQGERVLRLGDIGPGERRAGELKRRGGNGAAGNGSPLSYVIYGEEMDANSKQGGAALPVELQLRTRILDSLFAYGPMPRSGQPLLIAWSDNVGLEMQSPNQRAALQHAAVLLATPRVGSATNTLSLAQGWLAPSFESSQNSLCFGNLGAGITLGTEPAVLQLALPRDLYGMRAEALTLVTGADGNWLPETTVELYDWAARAWVSQPAVGKPLVIDEPEHFLSGHGTIRVRLGTTLSQPNFGCVYADVRLQGTMP